MLQGWCTAAKPTGRSIRRSAWPMTSKASSQMPRRAYQAALTAKPGDVSVLNNLGMSYALEGNLSEAEQTLRQAAAQTARQRRCTAQAKSGTRRGPAGAVRRGEADRQQGSAPRSGRGQYGLSQDHACAARSVAAAEAALERSTQAAEVSAQPPLNAHLPVSNSAAALARAPHFLVTLAQATVSKALRAPSPPVKSKPAKIFRRNFT